MEAKEFTHFDSVVKRMRDMFKKISNATTSMEVSKLEREGLELMRELQFTAPRIWNDFTRLSQEQRRLISQGLVEPVVEKSSTTTKTRKKKKTTRKKTTTRKKA